jgi:hypothetical protein
MVGIDIDMSSSDGTFKLRHQPFFVSQMNRPEFPTPGYLCNLTVRKCFVHDGRIYQLFTNTAEHEEPETDMNVDVTFRNIEIIDEDNYLGVFHNNSYISDNFLKMSGLGMFEIPVPETSQEVRELRGHHQYYKFSGGYSTIGFKYAPAGTEYYVENLSGGSVNMTFASVLIRLNGTDAYLITVPDDKILKFHYDSALTKFIAELI